MLGIHGKNNTQKAYKRYRTEEAEYNFSNTFWSSKEMKISEYFVSKHDSKAMIG